MGFGIGGLPRLILNQDRKRTVFTRQYELETIFLEPPARGAVQAPRRGNPAKAARELDEEARELPRYLLRRTKQKYSALAGE